MKSVLFLTCTKLPCIGTSSAPVILCLALTVETVSGNHFIPGFLLTATEITDECSCESYWRYAISYDENLLTDPEAILVPDDITSLFCETCFTDWIRTLIIPVCVFDSDTIDFELDEDGCVTGEVNISADVGNIIEAHADGIFAEDAGGAALCVTDSSTINFSITGGGCVTGSVILQPNGGENPVNILVANAEGLFVPAPTTPNFSGAIANMAGTGALPQALTVEANANAASFTINLPSAATVGDRIWFIKKVNTNANTVTLDPNGAQLIDGAATFVLTVSQQSVMIQSDGTGWIILASHL